jgi:hypothetical protein
MSPRVAVVAQFGLYRCERHVHDRFRFELFFLGILRSQAGDDLLAGCKGLGEKLLLIAWLSDFRTESLVLDVVRAQRVAVHEEVRVP